MRSRKASSLLSVKKEGLNEDHDEDNGEKENANETHDVTESSSSSNEYGENESKNESEYAESEDAESDKETGRDSSALKKTLRKTFKKRRVKKQDRCNSLASSLQNNHSSSNTFLRQHRLFEELVLSLFADPGKWDMLPKKTHFIFHEEDILEQMLEKVVENCPLLIRDRKRFLEVVDKVVFSAPTGLVSRHMQRL